MAVRIPLLQILADGRFHSGEALGRHLNVTRAAIWKQLRNLETLGLTVHAVHGRGYRLANPLELLQHDTIVAELDAASREQLATIEIFPEINSTNTYLKLRAGRGAPSGSVCLAEWQTAGRGRHGRSWVSPFGSNVYMSLLWRFPVGPAQLAGLSLVVGVAVARVLRGIAGPDIGLKWPNDLLWRGRKVAGILVEIAGESAGPSYAVIGLGVNVRMPDRFSDAIDQPWADLFHIAGYLPSRNRIAAAIMMQLVAAIEVFEREGLEPFIDEWREFDVVAGRSVQIQLSDEVIDGQAQGIDATGAFVVQVGDEVRRFASGEVSLRMIP